jgi:hypothetical protein
VLSLDLPPMPEDLGFEQIPDLAELLGVRGMFQKKLDSLVSERDRFAKERAAADSRKLAELLRGKTGFEGALRALDFAAIDEHLKGLLALLATEEARRSVNELRASLGQARTALAHVAAESDHWKRKTFNDPRARGRSSRDALGATAAGLLIKTDSGSELLPWSAFGAKPNELHQLFHQRLTREYTRDELVGIEALLRMTAVLQTVDETSEMLRDGTTSVLSEDEARAIFEGYDVARIWASALGDTRALDRESEAARLLIDSLRATSSGAWSRSVAGFERLLAEFRDTLLVRLLSDGR